MQKKPLTDQKEQQTLDILDKTLKNSPFRVFCKMRIIDVICDNEGDNLTNREKNFLRTAHFDFVVYKSKKPEFALEFDGPHHELDPKQQERDIIKNRLCERGKLPLIRISDIELEENDRITLLGYILYLFISWNKEEKSIREEIQDYVSELSKEELENLSKYGVLDPSIDASFIFNLRHRFPGTKRVARRLYFQFGIVSSYLDSILQKQAIKIKKDLRCWVSLSETNFSKDYCVEQKYKYCVFKDLQQKNELIWLSGKPATKGIRILYKGNIAFLMRTAFPIVDDYKPIEAPAFYFIRTGKMPVIFQEIPGVEISDVAEQFCEYLALRQIEKWAKKNIKVNG